MYNLKSGLSAWEGRTAAGPVEFGMVLLKGDETPEQVIILAYGMEEGLGEFYTKMSELSKDQDVVALLSKLAGIEEKHKQRLFELYSTFDHDISDRETFESKIMTKEMEGGFTTEEFLEHNKEAMQTSADVINIAMMLETQALDLYSRYSDKSKDEKAKEVLYNISEEEKAHLAALGQLMERIE